MYVCVCIYVVPALDFLGVKNIHLLQKSNTLTLHLENFLSLWTSGESNNKKTSVLVNTVPII